VAIKMYHLQDDKLVQDVESQLKQNCFWTSRRQFMAS